MFKKIIFLSVFFAGLSFGIANHAQAMDLSEIKYPIADLGGCTSQGNCKTYCEQKENMLACVDYAAKQGLISQDEAKIAQKSLPKIIAGQTPGQCNSKDACERFCKNNASNMKACVAFGEEVGALRGSELAQAKKVQSALEQGAQLPGGCTSKDSCETFCSDTQNIDSCLNFAEKADLISADDLTEARKIAPLLKAGKTPGQCTSKATCKTYCDKDNNFQECLVFAEKADLIPKGQLEIIRKTGGKGPGACRGEDQCKTFCDQAEHGQECLDFAKQKGLLSQEQLDEINNGVQRIKDGLDKTPAEIKPQVQSCLNNLFDGKLNAVLAGTEQITKNQGEKIGACFERAAEAFKEQMIQKGATGGASGTAPAGIREPKTNMPIIQRDEATKKQLEMQKKIQEQMQEKAKREMEKQLPDIERSQKNSIPPTDSQGAAPRGAPCTSAADCAAKFGPGTLPPQ